jgi:hypothetical protein
MTITAEDTTTRRNNKMNQPPRRGMIYRSKVSEIPACLLGRRDKYRRIKKIWPENHSNVQEKVKGTPERKTGLATTNRVSADFAVTRPTR